MLPPTFTKGMCRAACSRRTPVGEILRIFATSGMVRSSTLVLRSIIDVKEQHRPRRRTSSVSVPILTSLRSLPNRSRPTEPAYDEPSKLSLPFSCGHDAVGNEKQRGMWSWPLGNVAVPELSPSSSLTWPSQRYDDDVRSARARVWEKHNYTLMVGSNLGTLFVIPHTTRRSRFCCSWRLTRGR